MVGADATSFVLRKKGYHTSSSMPPPAKRMKQGENNTQKMNKEVLSFKEVQTTENEGSKSPNVCFRETDKENKIMDNMVQLENVEAQESPIKDSKVSLPDFFTAKEIESHLCSLNPSLNSKLDGKMVPPAVGENTCQLCLDDNLPFAAPAISCTCCGGLILHKSVYYWSQDGMGKRYSFCTKCFNGSSRGTISFSGGSISKATLNKDKNTEKSYEDWVQCDKCEQWQHQICALYNSEQDLEGKAKYICPFCRLKEREANISVPIHRPASGARNLLRTKLSDHIEERLFRRLEQERKQRAEILGKHPEEVPGASDLSVRVVLAADKQLKVKQQFLDIFSNETYPTEFPYKSKVILLFQKIEGVDVCLFAMYVKEFGSECALPNKGCIYISYIDSVKHFRPDDIKTSTGVALRTFVYHELLIGYLDYCKKKGFATCYIWACPSSKGDDYILNCHPENQRTPNSNKLVKWYKKIIQKAKDENIVVYSTNFYEKFFVSNGGFNSLARLPYFDGDYWFAAIEEIIDTMNNTPKNEGHQRGFKTMRRSDIVKEKLEQKIMNIKEEIMVVRLHYNCTNCDEPILCGGYWSCNQCSKFHLCARCPNKMKTHTDIHGEKHPLFPITLKTTVDTKMDDDTEIENGVLANNIFDDRLSFLNFCLKNYYQFDTLRRAKHSSMMILHHLHRQSSTNHDKVLMELLTHANECYPTKDNPCSNPICLRIKCLFLHTRTCKVRKPGGCIDCTKVWYMLSLHSKHCTNSDCRVPRCRDIKNYKKKMML